MLMDFLEFWNYLVNESCNSVLETQYDVSANLLGVLHLIISNILNLCMVSFNRPSWQMRRMRWLLK